MPGNSFWKVPNCTRLTMVPAPMPIVKAGAATFAGMPWLSMMGSAMTPIAMAAPTPYIEVNSSAVTSVMVMATLSGRSPASSTAERITLSAMPVWIRVCANQAPKTMMMTADAKATPPPCSTLAWMSLTPMPASAAQAMARISSMITGLCPRMISATTTRNTTSSAMPVAISMSFLPSIHAPCACREAGRRAGPLSEAGRRVRPVLQTASSGAVLGFVRAAIQHLHLALCDGRVLGQRLGRQVGVRRLLRVEIVVLVRAAHQHRAVALARDLPHIGRDVADGEPDPPVVRTVRRGAVEQQDVVQRSLSGLQLGEHGLVLVHLDGDLLAAGQQIVLVEGVAVRDLDLVRAGHELHATVHGVSRREGQPHGRHVRRAQPPIGRVLVPGDEARVVRLLDEEAAAPAQDVGTEHVFHGVQNARMADQLVEPGEQQVRFVPHRAFQRSAGARLVIFQPLAVLARFFGCQDVDWEIISIPPVFRDIFIRQHSRSSFPALHFSAA